MSDSDTTGRLSDRIGTTRRQLLAALGGTAAVGSMATGTSDTTDESEDAIQAGGLAADLTEQKRRETYVTANPGALDASVLKSGELFYSTDGELGVWDGKQKQHLPVGSKSNPVPAVHTEELYNDEEPNLDISEAWADVFSQSIRYRTVFESIDNLRQFTSGSGSISVDAGKGVELTTGTTSGSHAEIQLDRSNFSASPTWASDRRFAATVQFNNTDGPLVVGTGNFTEDNYSVQHVAFKMEGGSLLGSVADGSTENTGTVDASPSTGSGNEYQLFIEFVAGTSAKFWANKNPLTNSPDLELTSNLPSGIQHSKRLVHGVAENNSGTERSLAMMEAMVVQMP